MSRLPGFIAAPSDVRSEIVKNNRIGLIFANQLNITRKIILLFSAIWSLPAGIIKPDVKNISILCQKLCQLVAEIVVIFRCPVAGSVPIPRRQIKSELDAAPFTCFGSFPDNVFFARAVFHRMLRIFGRPKTETVVMLCSQHHSLHACCLDRFHPLIAVQIFRIKNRFRLGSLSPFPVRKGIYPKMNKRIASQLIPVQLALRRHNMGRLL